MTRIFLGVFIALFIVSCEVPATDYATLSGTIQNPNSDSLMVRSKTYSKTIAVASDGSFNDTLKLTPDIYRLFDGKEQTNIYLKNGFDLTLTLNTQEFDESITYSGEGAEDNNFLAAYALQQEKALNKDFSRASDITAMNAEIESAKRNLQQFVDAKSNLDSVVVDFAKKDLDPMMKSLQAYYGGILQVRQAFPVGSPAPTFEDYENFKGGTTSLSDLEGKFVYVDVWATWCAPCKAEIPYLKEIEADYHDKNIAFVSMSIDDDRTHGGSWEKAKSDWKAMVANKDLGGIQIYAPEGWQSDFVTGFQIKGIPRFILIDPEGNVADPSAPRPSNPELRETLNKLLSS